LYRAGAYRLKIISARAEKGGPGQGGVTPIATVLRSATAVKVGQDEILILTFYSVNFRALTIDFIRKDLVTSCAAFQNRFINLFVYKKKKKSLLQVQILS